MVNHQSKCVTWTCGQIMCTLYYTLYHFISVFVNEGVRVRWIVTWRYLVSFFSKMQWLNSANRGRVALIIAGKYLASKYHHHSAQNRIKIHVPESELC